MPKNKLRMLLAVFAGISVFIAIVLVMKIPARIATGNRAQFAIRQLDSMRPPMLAIEDAEAENLQDDQMIVFNRSAQKLRKQIAGYLDAARYNTELHQRVEQFSSAVENWLNGEEKLLKYRIALGGKTADIQTYKQLEQHYKATVGLFLQALKVLALGEQPIHQDITLGRKAGVALQILATLLILYLLTLIIIFQRISKRELLASFHQIQVARRDLARREEYLSLTLNSIGDAVIATDAKGLVTRMNPVAEQLTGWPEAQARGKPLKNIFHIVNAMTRKPVPDPVEKVLENGQIVGLANHTVLIGKDSNEYQIADSGAPIRDEDGNVFGVILVFRDVTEEYRLQAETLAHRDELEQRVSERTQELESFSYAVSHDLRAPLRSIQGFADALLEDNVSQLDDDGKDHLQRIFSAARRMSELIDALLVLSRINRADIHHTDVNLSETAHKIAEKLQEQNISHETEWRIADNLHVTGDADLLYAALENLLGNAWKYCSRNSGKTCIEFGAMKQDERQIFFVRDNGCGFNADYSDKLFTAFQRLHGSEYEGSGIGLATVRRIIERHNGQVWAESESDNGATFYFTVGWISPIADRHHRNPGQYTD